MIAEHSCGVCLAALGAPIYSSPAPVSITSICTVLQRPTLVYFCGRCGHLQTADLPEAEQFYDTDYKILAASEDEDQIYQVVDGRNVYRTRHQLDTLLGKVELPEGAAVLDYGCAKGATLKGLRALRPDIEPYLFDVSRDYAAYWPAICPPANQASYRLPEAWQGRLDVVLSFFVLEHVRRPHEVVRNMWSLLKPGGLLYFIVPNVFTNVGDFVVVDHINHFTADSLHHLLRDAGFGEVQVDDASHQGAFVVSARRLAAAPAAALPAALPLPATVAGMAAYWGGFAARVRAFENGHRGRPAAIYGSGFYGSFIAACLQDMAAVACFLDRNPHRWKEPLLGKTVIEPSCLPAGIATIYVGLNPARAREEIAKIESWRGAGHEYFFP
jgi:2-polyprenyl-3-methyl-5-hydroxy-6-metoxy-1,4-benzoquinol methylase